MCRLDEESMRNTHSSVETPELSVAPDSTGGGTRMTRAQVAARIGASTSTVRRYEGDRLHPHVDEDGTHWFEPEEVTALAATRANQALSRGRIRKTSNGETDSRSKGEI